MKRIFAVEGDYIEGDVRIITMTAKAYLVEHENGQAWIPKSQIVDIEHKGDMATIVVPEWLAKDKEMI